MVARKLELMRRYDETAGMYDSRYEEIQRAKYLVALRHLPDRVERVLDLGCGTGMFLEELSNRAEIVIGLDISSEMLKRAKARVKNVGLVQADADALPFLDGSFDAVVSVTLLQNMPDPATTVVEVARVLRLGGVAVFTALKHKHGKEEVQRWVKRAGMRIVSSGEIERSEDVFCVTVR